MIFPILYWTIMLDFPLASQTQSVQTWFFLINDVNFHPNFQDKNLIIHASSPPLSSLFNWPTCSVIKHVFLIYYNASPNIWNHIPKSHPVSQLSNVYLWTKPSVSRKLWQMAEKECGEAGAQVISRAGESQINFGHCIPGVVKEGIFAMALSCLKSTLSLILSKKTFCIFKTACLIEIGLKRDSSQ